MCEKQSVCVFLALFRHQKHLTNARYRTVSLASYCISCLYPEYHPSPCLPYGWLPLAPGSGLIKCVMIAWMGQRRGEVSHCLPAWECSSVGRLSRLCGLARFSSRRWEEVILPLDADLGFPSNS